MKIVSLQRMFTKNILKMCTEIKSSVIQLFKATTRKYLIWSFSINIYIYSDYADITV